MNMSVILQEDIEKIVNTAFSVLERTGVDVHSEEAINY